MKIRTLLLASSIIGTLLLFSACDDPLETIECDKSSETIGDGIEIDRDFFRDNKKPKDKEEED